MKPGKFFTLTILLTLLIFLLPAGVVAVYDPFFVLHRPFFMDKPLFDGTDRYQNAGLINSFLADPTENFDTVIIGTSMSQNFPVNNHTIKLTLAGGRAKELAALAAKAIATGNVKNVVWEVFTPYGDENPEAVHPQSPLPMFLYNDTHLDDWRYVFNNDVVEEALKLTVGKVKKRKPLDTLYTWTDDNHFKKFHSPDHQRELRDEITKATLPLRATLSNDMSAKRFPNIEQNLLPIVRAHSEIQFSLYFPPVSYAAYALVGNEGFWKEMAMRRALLNAVKDLNNVSVYGFDLEDAIGDKITNYRDPNHYRPWVNDKILQAMKHGDHKITLDGWDSYTAALSDRINRFAAEFTAVTRCSDRGC